MELLETRYPEFPGLNLSREVLDAQATRTKDGTAPPPLLETQVVDAADSIAYDTHDADDAIELGLVSLEELLELPLVAEAATRVRDRLGPLGDGDLRRAVIHELVDFQVAELVRTSLARLRGLGIRSVAEVRAAGTAPERRMIGHTPAVAAAKRDLERFLFTRVYRSERVLAVRVPAQQRLVEVFDWYTAHADQLPPRYQERAAAFGVPRSTADYIAGMTDRFLEADHGRRFAD